MEVDGQEAPALPQEAEGFDIEVGGAIVEASQTIAG